MIEDEKHFRQRILDRLSSLGDEDDATKDHELLVAANQLRLAGKVRFDLGNGKMLTCCIGCDAFFILDSHSKAKTQCDKCKHKKHNEVRYSKLKEANKEERTSVDSKTNVTLLDKGELKERVSNLNKERKVNCRRLQRAVERIGKMDLEARVSKKMLKHMKQAAENFVKKSKNMSTEGSIQKIIDQIVENSTYDDNKPISREATRRYLSGQ